jgi:hypothetical protein
MRIYIYATLLVVYVLGFGVAALGLAALGIDIHIRGDFFVIRAAWGAILFSILSAPVVVLVLLIRRERRRKRLVESAAQ